MENNITDTDNTTANIKEEFKSTVIKLYSEGVSISKISRDLNRKYETVSKVINDAGIKRQPLAAKGILTEMMPEKKIIEQKEEIKLTDINAYKSVADAFGVKDKEEVDQLIAEMAEEVKKEINNESINRAQPSSDPLCANKSDELAMIPKFERELDVRAANVQMKRSDDVVAQNIVSGLASLNAKTTVANKEPSDNEIQIRTQPVQISRIKTLHNLPKSIRMGIQPQTTNDMKNNQLNKVIATKNLHNPKVKIATPRINLP